MIPSFCHNLSVSFVFPPSSSFELYQDGMSSEHQRASDAFAMQSVLGGEYGFPQSNDGHKHNTGSSHGECSHSSHSSFASGKNNLDVSSGKAATMDR